MKNLINPAQKDAVLQICLENSENTRESEMDYTHFEHIVSFEELEEIIHQFKRLGFIEIFQLGPGDIYIRIKPEADQFVQRGGFYGQEILFQQSVEILLSELEKSKPLFPEQAEKIISTIGNVSSFLALVHQVKRV